MNDEKNQKGKESFWTTLPGCLTGIAAIITAIGGIVAILFSAGLLELPKQSLSEALTPTSTPSLSFAGTWQGTDSEDDSIISLILKQTGNQQVEGTFSDTFSKQLDGTIIRPGSWGNGSGKTSSPTEAEMSFYLTSSKNSGQINVHLILSNQNNTLTLEIPQSPSIILHRQ